MAEWRRRVAARRNLGDRALAVVAAMFLRRRC